MTSGSQLPEGENGHVRRMAANGALSVTFRIENRAPHEASARSFCDAVRATVRAERLTLCAAVLSSAMLSCGGRETIGTSDSGPNDAGPNDGNEVVCTGDRWGGSAEMLDAIGGCTTISGNLSVTGNQLMNVELRLLTKVDGFLTVWGNPILTRVTLPMLASVGGRLDVSANVTLTSLEMPALKSVNERAVPAVYDVVIGGNALPACQTDAIRDRLLANGFHGTMSISGDGGACPP
jgi:Receptor L domain